ncbi:PilD-dependent protein PddA [Limihaloglobus sulfuriphilus]|uniref:PilD-dependent protein PddA n=1 Tax=Limihaloglobus sulfuriphilus TaxID=1851148 RepID=A0A1Q2MH80_9BACT|nr:prepilin-type N-terminal cleavage/methylation domain-containing protein [Limihaloglobus sulfuriphilus]AQQ72009.1 PilD-dependent protein PddA [Limihaloglobus sulfuriphilus]
MKRKGFTLVELMVVVLIVAILAAVTIPLLRGRIDAAKWAEGKAGIGTIATAIRAMYAESGGNSTYGSEPATLGDLGFESGDLDGTYFSGPGDDGTGGDYAFNIVTWSESDLVFTVTCTSPEGGPDGGPFTYDSSDGSLNED